MTELLPPVNKWGWKRDPSVKQIKSCPPDGHVRRCQGRNEYLTRLRGENVQCGRWALRGLDYCRRHGSTRKRHTPKAVANWYSKYAGPLLRDKLEEMRAAPPDQRVALESEIDMARVLAAQTIACFDKICVQGEVGSADETTAQLMRAQATVAARDAMSFVAGIVDKAARVRSLSEGTIDLELVNYIIVQVQKIIEQRIVPLPNGVKLCNQIVEDMKGIALPNQMHDSRSAQSRALEVRGLLQAMDLTVMGATVNEITEETDRATKIGMPKPSSNGNGKHTT